MIHLRRQYQTTFFRCRRARRQKSDVSEWVSEWVSGWCEWRWRMTWVTTPWEKLEKSTLHVAAWLLLLQQKKKQNHLARHNDTNVKQGIQSGKLAIIVWNDVDSLSTPRATCAKTFRDMSSKCTLRMRTACINAYLTFKPTYCNFKESSEHEVAQYTEETNRMLHANLQLKQIRMLVDY